MSRESFTVGEVEALIPALEKIFVDVLHVRAGLRAIESELERSNVRQSRDELLESDDGPVSVRRAKAVYRGFVQTLSDQIDRVTALGGEVKDVESGLVDFPSSRLGEDILLCWRLGEKKIGFWHPVDGGFASRRPIDDEVARAPQPLE
jgi:hypothetical protein